MYPLRPSLSLHPLAASLALLLGVSDIHAAPLAAPAVTNCLDHGAGSLRQAVIDDTTSAPIDLTQLTCGRITLTTGAINVQRAQLIQGPGASKLEIDGARLDRVFSQTSTQTLALYGLTIQNGYTNSFGGGCVYTAGPLQLNGTVVRNCVVSDSASTSTIKGGGADVHGALIAINSSIVDNQALLGIRQRVRRRCFGRGPGASRSQHGQRQCRFECRHQHRRGRRHRRGRSVDDDVLDGRQQPRVRPGECDGRDRWPSRRSAARPSRNRRYPATARAASPAGFACTG